MADSRLPENWQDAAKDFFGNLTWISPLVTLERAIEGYYGQAVLAAGIWGAAVLISIRLQAFKNIWTDRLRRRRLFTWFLITAGGALLVWGIALLAIQPRSQTADEQASLGKAQQELAAERKIREALDKELAKARSQILAIERQRDVAVDASQRKTFPPAIPPSRQKVEFRRLSAEQMRVLVHEFATVRKDIPELILTSANDVRGEAHQYMRDFLEVFERAGIKAETTGQSPSGPEQEGVMISVSDVSHPSASALTLEKILKSAGIETTFVMLPQNLKQNFALFIGPNPL
jgi:hypothetical protein